MTIPHRWVRPVLLDTDSQSVHALPLSPDLKLHRHHFHTAVCGREVLLADDGEDPGPEAERCVDCRTALDDPAARARILAALPLDDPDPTLFVLVRPHTPMDVGTALVAPKEPVTHTVPVREFHRLHTEFTALCNSSFTWSEVDIVEPSAPGTPCPVCVLIWTLDRSLSGPDGSDPS